MNMASATDNVKLGVCSVLFDGVNLGFTKGGVEVEVATTTHEIKVDQLGESVIGELLTGRTVSATVPMAETTLENLARIMPGSVMETDGVKAVGTITLATAAPVNGDRITIGGEDVFTFRTAPAVEGDVKIGTGTALVALAATAANLAAAINASNIGYVATSAAGVVTITAKTTGTGWNKTAVANFTTPANVTLVAPVGGTNATYARVIVSTGVNVNLLDVAKKLVLRPRGTFGEDDFTIYKAATPGALSFAYSVENERVYNANFKGYVLASGQLFAVGN
jgi:hypothetical protein